MLIWDLNSGKSILVNFDQINDKHWGLCLQGKQFEGSGESSSKTRRCVSVCALLPMSLHACLIICVLLWGIMVCPVLLPDSPIYTLAPSLLIDGGWMRLEQTTDAAVLDGGSQIQLHSSRSFFAWSSACWFQIPVGLFVILTNTSKRARTANTPKEFHREAASPRVCFTFNDAHIRELGGSLLPLSRRGSAPDYSLASDSPWWMA